MDTWTAEFCTVCDKQCFMGSVYCSDDCKEADLRSKQRFHTPSPFPFAEEVFTNVHDTESSDENSEIPNLWLSSSSVGQRKPIAEKLRSSAPKTNEHAFRYASPILKPYKVSGAASVSPLLIPQSSQASSLEKTEQISVQSISTYKRWLSQGIAE